MLNSSNDIVLITGGSSGIGFEMARLLLEENYLVIICGRSKLKLEEAQRKLPKLITIQCDITSTQDRERLVDRIKNEYPSLTLLINNAGVVYRYLMEKTGDLNKRMEEEWKTNVMAPVELSQLLLPCIAKNGGTVVNVSSALAHVPLSIEPHYCATKAALHSITQSMRIRYKKVGVKVVEIFYPEVDTPFQEGHATERAISPEVAAYEALRQLKRGKDEIYVKRSKMMFRISRLLPKKGVKIINGFLPEMVEEMLSKR